MQSKEVLFTTKRLNSLILLAAVIIFAALFQYAQLRQERILQLQKTIEVSGKKLDQIIAFENQGLIDLANTHSVGSFSVPSNVVDMDFDAYMEIQKDKKSFLMKRINPRVPYEKMGTLFGVNPARYSEVSYQRELLSALNAMAGLESLEKYSTSAIQTFYYSYKGMMAVQPWIDIADLMRQNNLPTVKALLDDFEELVYPGNRNIAIHFIENSVINQGPVLILSRAVVTEDTEMGSYGAVLDLNALKDEIYFDSALDLPFYVFVEDRVAVEWDANDMILFPIDRYVHGAESQTVNHLQRDLWHFDLLYMEPNHQYGLGLRISEWQVFLSVLPKLWVYLVLIFALLIFFVSFETMMLKRYYKPALVLSRVLNGNREEEALLEGEHSELWKPIYQRIKEYFNLVSITNSLPGAILQIVKSGDKYVIKYYTKGLNELFKQEVHYPLPAGADFLRLFDPNSYWNLENLLRDSEAYMIPIEYEACLNTEHVEKTYVSILLKPIHTTDKNVFWEGMIINVTDRRILEQELSEEKKFIEKLFNLSGALFAVLDKDLSIVRCNQSFIQLFAKIDSKEESPLLIEQIFAPFDFVNFKDQFNQVMSGAAAGMFEHYWILPDGRKKLVKTTIAPTYDSENQVEYVILTAIDISDRYKIEEELKKTNQSLYIKNAQVERSARIQKELFKTFEELRNVETIEEIYETLTKVITQISHFHNFVLALKPNKLNADMKVMDVVGNFTADNYSNYFHYFRGVLGRVLLSRVPYITGNVLNDPDYILDNPNVRSVIFIPITYNNFLWGVLGIDSYVENAFSKMDFEILNVLSSHLGLYMEELHNRLILKNEADQLRGLHHVIQDISALRDNDDIAQKIVENGLLKHLAIFKTTASGDYEMIAESDPTSYALFGIMPNYAILDHALSKNKMINGRIGALNVFHLANPVSVNGQVAGLLYSIKDHEFSIKDEELILIISEQMAVFWRMNDMIERANKDALVDPLTSIWNRRYMIDRLTQENYRTNRYNNPATVAIIDLGDFKAINDSYGHNVGDSVLQEMANEFNGLIRESDFVGRYGGDEFIVFMPNTDYEQGLILLSRIATTIESRFYSPHNLHLFIDFGIATVPSDNQDLFEAVKIADERMYTLKNARKAQS